MAAHAFDTAITETADALSGPWRRPRQMLQAQTYDAHASIHDDATAQKLGFKGGTIEGPTHFSQFAPLGERLWGRAWFETGCLSAHYRSVCYEGEEVQAILSKPLPGTSQCQIQMIKRDGTELTLKATPALKEVKDLFGNSHRIGVLGIQYNAKPDESRSIPVGFFESIKIGFEQVWFIIATTFKFIASLFAGAGSAGDVGGPIRIAQLSGQAASLGFQFVVQLCATLSVSIGLLNLFPVPLLDGGHLLFYGVEAVRGRPLSERAQEMGFRIGLGLVLMLMVFATYNDILHLAGS